MKPLIGITCSGDLNGEIFQLRSCYAGAVAAAGGLPLMLPAVDGIEPELARVLDGFILSGGGDLDPAIFGEEPVPLSGRIDPARDRFELVLTRLVLESEKPVLGICRGLQVLNVAMGGTVCQDLTLSTANPLKHSQQAPRWYPTHRIDLLPDSLLAGLLNTCRVRVNSFHHQHVGVVAYGLNVTARSPDGIIEGLEALQRNVVGVQFHPEEMWESRRVFLNIFKWLVQKAAAKRVS